MMCYAINDKADAMVALQMCISLQQQDSKRLKTARYNCRIIQDFSSKK